MAELLVVEDDETIGAALTAGLRAHGHAVSWQQTGHKGLDAAAGRAFDMALLDLGLPDLDGLEVTKRLREWTTVPIIVLSARGQERDKVAALDAGADDYLTKPFGVAELMARMRVALRHTAQLGPAGEAIFTVDRLRLDLARRRVFVEDQEVHLTPIEYKLLTTLAQHAGKVVTQRQLLQAVWGPGYATETHYLRVYMGQLRHKLEADPARPRYLLTEPGVGYRLAVE
jgi:two-component system KDP operon response regulator KdpE